MTGPVLVPLDGSEKDARALPVAAALAELSGAAIRLVRVIATSDGLTHSHELYAGAAAPPVIDRADIGRALAGTAARFASGTGCRVAHEVLEAGDVPDAIVHDAVARDALAVVMGTRAASTAARAIAGSVADRVMRECPRPVVLVPPRAAHLEGHDVRIGRVLVPLDGSALAARALDFLLRLPHATRLEYVLFRVVPPDGTARGDDEPDDDAAIAERVAAAEAELSAAAAKARAAGAAEVEVRVVEHPQPAEAIVEAVREFLVEMIAMSTRGAGGLRRLVLGSVAEGVVRRSEVPVLLLTPTSLAG